MEQKHGVWTVLNFVLVRIYSVYVHLDASRQLCSLAVCLIHSETGSASFIYIRWLDPLTEYLLYYIVSTHLQKIVLFITQFLHFTLYVYFTTLGYLLYFILAWKSPIPFSVGCDFPAPCLIDQGAAVLH